MKTSPFIRFVPGMSKNTVILCNSQMDGSLNAVRLTILVAAGTNKVASVAKDRTQQYFDAFARAKTRIEENAMSNN